MALHPTNSSGALGTKAPLRSRRRALLTRAGAPVQRQCQAQREPSFSRVPAVVAALLMQWLSSTMLAHAGAGEEMRYRLSGNQKNKVGNKKYNKKI